MSLSASQCSEGCESGWTIYLNESSSPSSEESPRQEEFYRGGTKAKGEEEEEEEEENLSMVSDASSGQPFCEVEDDCSNKSCSSGKRRSKKKAAKENDNGKGEQQHLNYYYEDTACSPHLKFTEQEKIRSQNFHHDEKSAPAAEKANSVKKGGLKSRKWA